jgi:hypothetical protein
MLGLILMMLVAAGQAHDPLHARGAKVMGFDQDKTAHHFYLYEDGGAIDVAIKDASNTKDRDAIRTHLPHVMSLFAEGNFTDPMLVHDTRTVPGTEVMSKLKDRISYKYVETPAGGRVDIVTKDRSALAAVHEFLSFQIKDHRTGDPVTVTKRK